MANKAIKRTHKDLMEFLELEVDTPIEQIDVSYDNIGQEWIILVASDRITEVTKKASPRRKRISFLARRGEEPSKRVSFTIQSKATKLETRLFDALDNLIGQLYADGITATGERGANNALNEYTTKYGQRHDGKPRN